MGRGVERRGLCGGAVCEGLRVEGGRVVLGSYVAGTHRLVDNENCPILTEGLQGLLRNVVNEVP